jgi:uncharacterized protein (TIRG00374 family)
MRPISAGRPLTSAFGGREVGPGTLPIEGALDGADVDAFVATLLREGCIGETRAAVEAREMLGDELDRRRGVPGTYPTFCLTALLFTHEFPCRHRPVTNASDHGGVRDTRGRIRIAATIVGCVAAAALLARVVSQADPQATWRALTGAGPFVILGLAPFAIGMTLDAWGQVVLLRAMGHRTTLAQLLPVRFASESLHVTVPAGFVAADTATTLMLRDRCDVPVRDGVVASIARKWLVMRSHAGYIAVGAIVGFPALAVVSQKMLGSTAALPWIVLASASVPLALSSAVATGLLGRSTFSRLHQALARLPWRWLQRWLEASHREASATDGQVTRLRASRSATLLASLAFLGAWCFEALESVLLLHLAGADVGFAPVFAVEAGLSLVRSAVVIAPSGLGVVDLGYATVLPMLGADAGAAPAFVLLKRAKEVVWVLFGYALAYRSAGAHVARHSSSVA